MTDKKTVKVVKRAERTKRPTSVRAAREKKRKTATDMVATVTSWVNDLQQKQRIETSKAIESLVRARQQPNEA
jgi:hypothetical protein